MKHNSFKWYIIRVKSGLEEKALLSLKNNINKIKLLGNLGEALIPEENASKITNGERKIFKRKLYPGYMMINLDVNGKVNQAIKNTKNVRFWVKKISNIEIKQIKKNIETGKRTIKSFAVYEILENVKIVSGPFENFVGCIHEIDVKEEKVKVTVNIFGRDTPVNLAFSQIEKLSN